MSITIQCPYCGSAEFDKAEKGKAKCRACGSVFFKNTGEQIAKNAGKLSKDESIMRLRENIRSEVDSVKADVNQVRAFCNEILKAFPDDFLATFYLTYTTSAKNPEKFVACLHRDLTDVDDYAVQEAVSFLIEHYSLKFERDIISFVKGCKNRLTNYKDVEKRIEVLKKRLENESDRYAKIARDVFICYVSNYKSQAFKIHEFLTEQNVSHFFSPWNLTQSTVTDYWEDLEYAIKNAKVFLVISGYYTEHNESGKNDALREMIYAERFPYLQRIEYKIPRNRRLRQSDRVVYKSRRAGFCRSAEQLR